MKFERIFPSCQLEYHFFHISIDTFIKLIIVILFYTKIGRPKPIPPPRSQSLEANNLQNISNQDKSNASGVEEIAKKISLPGSNAILEHFSAHPLQPPPSSPPPQVYADIGKIYN